MIAKKIYYICILIIILNSAASGQVNWQRSQPAEKPDLQLFHSLHVANLPTAETMKKGDFEFEVWHRFYQEFTADNDAFYGLDGPANIRLGLKYAPTDWMLVSLGRSNLNDNIDLDLKFRLFQLNHEILPALFGFRTGAAWNRQVFSRDRSDSRNFQYYGQLIINTMIGKKLGIGFIPSFLTNSDIFAQEEDDSFTFGGYLQFYFTNRISVFIEQNFNISGYDAGYDPFTTGIEMDTGGHFFKIFLTNSLFTNQTQFLMGTHIPVERDRMRLGFNITRVFNFN